MAAAAVAAVIAVILIAAALLPDNGLSVQTTQPSPVPAKVLAAVRPCRESDLRAQLSGTRVVAGEIVYELAFENDSRFACHIYGWPKVRLLDGSARRVSRAATRAYYDPVGATWPAPIVMAPRTAVVFRLSLPQPLLDGRPCKPAAFMQVYTPAGTRPMRVRVRGHRRACRATGLATAVTGLGPSSGG